MESKAITEPIGSKPFEVTSPFWAFVNILVWDAHILRFMLEAVVVIVLYHQSLVFFKSISPLLLNVSALHIALISFLISATMYLDSVVLCSGFGRFRKSFNEACRGDLDNAVIQLTSAINSFLPPPNGLVLLQLSELESMLELKERSQKSLDKAFLQGIPRGVCLFYGMRSALFSTRDEKLSQSIVEASIPDDLEYEDKITLRLERALYMLCQESLYRDARSEFLAIKESKPLGHPSMVSTIDLSLVGDMLCSLHLGKSEEVLPQLENLMPFIIAHAESNDGLRPYAAFFLLERAKYYKKRVHSDQHNKQRVREDVLTALSLCRFPAHQELAKELL